MTKLRYIILTVLTLLGILLPQGMLAVNKNGDFVVVIDPGHGGHDVGATDNGGREKDINLGVAIKFAELLRKKMKDVEVVMTRSTDTYLTLQQRADIANNAKGDLFISIHTNSLDAKNPNRRKVSGTSVYALGLHKDQKNMDVARRENSVIELEKNYDTKYSGFDPNKDESYIIFEMAQKKNLGQSLKFANIAKNELVATAHRSDRGVKQAGFWVLWATSMPAVLVELDFICNPDVAKYLTSEKGEEEMAEALYNALKSYRASLSQNQKIKAMADSEIKKSEKLIAETEPEKNEVKTVSEKTAVAEKKTAVEPAVVKNKTANKSGSRRRRNSSAKEISDDHNYETETITARRRESKTVKEDIKETTVSASAPVKTDEKASSDKKKSKKNKRKKNNQNSETIVSKEGDIISSTANQSDNKPASARKETKKKKKGKTKIDRMVTVYKIQILASPDRLKQNNPRFCGLKPISSFKERNLYKYTVGETSDRKEIEALLKKVKEKIPDAFIISTKKETSK